MKRIQENFMISLPKSLGFVDNQEVKLKLIKHLKPEIVSNRPSSFIEKDFVDIKHFIPKKTQFDHDIFVIGNNSKIFIWSPIPGGTNMVSIKRFADLESFFEVIGFLWGDGSTEGVRSIRFTNSEPECLLKVMKFFDSIGINRNIWKVQIIVSSSTIIDEEIKNECKNFWSTSLKIPIENIRSVSWFRSKTQKTRFGSSRIFIDSSILFEIFVNGALRLCKEKIMKDKIEIPIARSLLRGIIAAESDLGFQSRSKSIRRVGISFDPHSDESVLFKKLFRIFGINISGFNQERGRFNIDGWQNFSILKGIEAFRFHKTKNVLFNEGFSIHRKTLSSLSR